MGDRCGDLISRQAAIDTLAEWHDEAITNRLNNLQPANAVEVVRCKDCKHRPTGADRDDLEFPDERCPCQCEDGWYNWKPADDWYCGNGEREDGDDNGQTGRGNR